MRMRYKFWHDMAVSAASVSQELSTFQLLWTNRCEFVASKFVTHHICKYELGLTLQNLYLHHCIVYQFISFKLFFSHWCWYMSKLEQSEYVLQQNPTYFYVIDAIFTRFASKSKNLLYTLCLYNFVHKVYEWNKFQSLKKKYF